MHDADKRAAALAAAAEVRDGMMVGLGTGSTAAFAIARLGERVRDGLDITAVATSEASAAQARACGIRMVDFAGVAQVDLTIDGADEIDAALRAIKGAGGAMLREKVVAAASRRMIVIADGSKRVAEIGAAKLPVEVVPFAAAAVSAKLVALFGCVEARGGGAYRTDNGNMVLDGFDARERDWPALAARISAIPGVAGHGLFLTEVDSVFIADGGVVSHLERTGSSE